MTELMPRIQKVQRSFSLDSLRTWFLVIATIILLGVIYMGQASQAAMTGQRTHDKQDKLERTLRENAQLQADIAGLLVLPRLEARAKALGLHPPYPDQIKTITVKDYPTEPAALAMAERAKPAVPADGSFDLAAWWRSVLARLGLSSGSRAAEATTNP